MEGPSPALACWSYGKPDHLWVILNQIKECSGLASQHMGPRPMDQRQQAWGPLPTQAVYK